MTLEEKEFAFPGNCLTFQRRASLAQLEWHVHLSANPIAQDGVGCCGWPGLGHMTSFVGHSWTFPPEPCGVKRQFSWGSLLYITESQMSTTVSIQNSVHFPQVQLSSLKDKGWFGVQRYQVGEETYYNSIISSLLIQRNLGKKYVKLSYIIFNCIKTSEVVLWFGSFSYDAYYSAIQLSIFVK